MQRGKEIQQARSDLKQLATFYQTYNTEFGRSPTADELKTYIQRDAPKLFQALEQGLYVVVPRAALDSNTVIAYESKPDLRGNRLVAMGDTAVKGLDEKEFQAAIKAKGR